MLSTQAILVLIFESVVIFGGTAYLMYLALSKKTPDNDLQD